MLMCLLQVKEGLVTVTENLQAEGDRICMQPNAANAANVW